MLRQPVLRPRRTTSSHVHPRAARGLRRAGARPARCATIGLSQRDALGRGGVRARGRAARPAAHRHGAEPLQPDATARVDNGLDEMLYRSGVSLLAYSPLAFGALTGKYDAAGLRRSDAQPGRLAIFETHEEAALGPARGARRGAALQRAGARTWPDTGALALAFCYGNWRVASTIIGVTTRAQLDENLDAWGTRCRPSCWRRSTRSAGRCATRRSSRHDVAQEGARTSARRRRRSALRRARRRLHRAPVRLRRARRHRRVGAPARRGRARGREDAGDAGRAARSRCIVLMHGDRQVSTEEPGARRSARRRSSRARPRRRSATAAIWSAARRRSARRKAMPVYVEASILALPHIWINGGRRGYLVGIERRGADRSCWTRKPVRCARAESAASRSSGPPARMN